MSNKEETRQAAIRRILGTNIEALSVEQMNGMVREINSIITGINERQSSSKVVNFELEWAEQQIEALKKKLTLIEQKILLANAAESPEDRISRLTNETDDNQNFRKFLLIKLSEATTKAESKKAKASLLQLDVRDEIIEKEVARLQDLLIARDLGDQLERRDWNNNIAAQINSPKKGKAHYDRLERMVALRNSVNDVRNQLGGEDDALLRCRMLDENTGEQCVKSFRGISNRKRHEKTAHPDGTMIVI